MADTKVNIAKLSIKESTKDKKFKNLTKDEMDRLLFEVAKRLGIVVENMSFE